MTTNDAFDFERFRRDYNQHVAEDERKREAARREGEQQRKADDKRSTRRCIAGAVPAAVVFFVAFIALRYLTAGLDGRDGALTDVVFMVVYAVVTARVLFWWGERPSRTRRR